MSDAPTGIRFTDFWSLRYAAGGSPLTQSLSQRIGAVCAWTAYRTGLSPSAVTLAGATLFALTAAAFAALQPHPAATLLIVAGWQLAYGLDCADGQLARATGQASDYGAWLDVACDYLRNAAIALAVAYRLQYEAFDSSLAFLCAFVLLTGTIVKLHTVTTLRQVSDNPTGQAGPLRWLLRVALDTATYLMILGLLHGHPAAIAGYALAMGTAYGGLACWQAGRRLSR